jgi:hypothetical protein
MRQKSVYETRVYSDEEVLLQGRMCFSFLLSEADSDKRTPG